MAINIPIVSEFNNAGLKKAQREFNKLEKTCLLYTSPSPRD